MSTVGRDLRRIRVQAGLTQAEVAARAGMSRSNLSDIESGRKEPSTETALKVLSAIRGRDRLKPELRLDPQTPVNIEHSHAAALKVASAPVGVKPVVERRLNEMRAAAGGSAVRWFDFWDTVVCRLDPAEIVHLLMSTDHEDIDLRKVCPVFVLLSREDDLEAIGRAERDLECDSFNQTGRHRHLEGMRAADERHRLRLRRDRLRTGCRRLLAPRWEVHPRPREPGWW